ncbi:MAG TPA: hypothetical protein VHW01_13230 [Polyangiaceae bacterium]|jgi:hypothetical protein|nr:hypothetical protein [Polyangiaceae bacterium]
MNAISAITPKHRRPNAALAGITLVLTTGSLLAAPKQPPSSLQRSGAVVRFSHTHERVASCRLQVSALACTTRTVPAAAGVDFTLSPKPGKLVSEPTPPREPITVSLPSRQGASNLEVRVQTGNWALSWADQRIAFHVDAQRDFAAQLKTTSGACIFEEGQCRKHDEIVTRTFMIPPESLGAL